MRHITKQTDYCKKMTFVYAPSWIRSRADLTIFLMCWMSPGTKNSCRSLIPVLIPEADLPVTLISNKILGASLSDALESPSLKSPLRLFTTLESSDLESFNFALAFLSSLEPTESDPLPTADLLNLLLPLSLLFLPAFVKLRGSRIHSEFDCE